MAQQTINIGTVANDGTGDTIRDGGDKINDNFTELYAADVALDTRVDALEAADTAFDTRIDALEAGGGAGITVEEDGSSEGTGILTLNFTTGLDVSVTGTGATISASGGGGGGGAWHLQGGPLDNEAPAANFATLDTRNLHPVLDFDTTTQEAAVWTRFLPPDYAGGGITITVAFSATSATSGTAGFDVAIERIDPSSLDIDADSFATAQTLTALTVPGTSGQVLYGSLNISNGANMDSLAAGELFRLRIRRDVTNDTAAGDIEVLRWLIVEQ